MKHIARKSLYGILIALLLLSTLNAQAAPADPFTGEAPSFDTAAPEKNADNLGDWGVSEQRAAATYTYPIDVLPGRNNMVPALALRYSSRSASNSTIRMRGFSTFPRSARPPSGLP